jgi:hypothetical protein
MGSGITSFMNFNAAYFASLFLGGRFKCVRRQAKTTEHYSPDKVQNGRTVMHDRC